MTENWENFEKFPKRVTIAEAERKAGRQIATLQVKDAIQGGEQRQADKMFLINRHVTEMWR